MRRREKSIAYKGRENNSMSLLRIGKKLVKIEDFKSILLFSYAEKGQKLRILLAEPSPSSFVCALLKSSILKSIIGKKMKYNR